MNSLLKLLSALLLTGAALYTAKLALPLFAPFLISAAGALLMEPAVSALHRRGVRRSLAAGLMAAMLLALAAGLLGSLAAGGAHILTDYAKKAPALLTALTQTINRVDTRLTRLLGAAPAPVARQLRTAVEGVTDQLSDLPMTVSKQALSWATELAKASPDWVLFACTALMGVYFFSLYLPDLKAFAARQLSPALLDKLQLVRQVTGAALGGYVKVQCILSGVTFLILLPAMWALQVEDALSAALGIAVIDALPILGSGAVLLPWAAIALTMGRPLRALGLMGVYGVLLVTHNFLQPRLMGTHLGLHPVTALVSLYVGWKLAGIAGMLLLPIACTLLCSFNEAGIVHLWK